MRLAIVLGPALLLSPTLARAGDEAPRAPITLPIMVADVVSATLVLGGLSIDSGASSSISQAGMLGLVLAAPAIHLGHGRPGEAAGSLFLRFGAPFVGGLAGFVVAAALQPPEGGIGPGTKARVGDREAELMRGFAIGAGGGLVLAMLFDWCAISRWQPRARTGARPRSQRPRLLPTVALTPGSTNVGIAGSF